MKLYKHNLENHPEHVNDIACLLEKTVKYALCNTCCSHIEIHINYDDELKRTTLKAHCSKCKYSILDYPDLFGSRYSKKAVEDFLENIKKHVNIFYYE